ncbi:MAG: methylmalonyl-CoA carboxyltransferase [Alphaproteobacteria bacterium]|nr:MAG: methylmalonyl-CoA carboxyltransferase [Alphaproteobacteria bacterium]
MGWEKSIEELRRREALSLKMGGAEKVERQISRGKLTVRDRIDRLFDDGTFREIGALAGKAEYDDDGNLTDFVAANTILGRGKINDRTVVVQADDFTVRGGAADAAIAQKQIMAEQMANELRLPLVRLIDGTGGGGSVKTLETGGRTYIPRNPGWDWVVANMSTVPVVGLALGPVAGLGAARCVTSHYSVMVKELSQLFVAGPPVAKRLGEDVTKEELGGSWMHTRNGAIDDEVNTEDGAIERARQFLSYLPSSVHELPPRGPQNDSVDRVEDFLLNAIPEDRRKVYKMRPIIKAVVDEGSFFEMSKNFGRSLITGLARLDGWPVAIMAGDPYFYGGGWTTDTSHKVIRFTELAETFHLPVVHLVDNPGFAVGVQYEKTAHIRHGSRALATVYQATVPWCSVIVRKAFGVAGAAHMNPERLRYRFAWPSADWGSLPIEGGIEAAYKSDLAASDDPEALLADITERLNRVRSPFRGAEAFLIEDIIDPRETRARLCEFANLAAPLRTPGLSAFPMRP